MASKSLFKSASLTARTTPAVADTKNLAGGNAFSLADEAALAQMACTGTLGSTYYASAESQLTETVRLARAVSPEFLAKVAVYSRDKGFMKDSAALLLAVLFDRDVELKLFKSVFPRVVDNGKMLKNFVQIVRSGQAGRKSFGTAGKKAIQNWLNSRSDAALFSDSVGNDPSLADVIKMVHPKGNTPARQAFYAYLIGKSPKDGAGVLPEIVQKFEAFKVAPKGNRAIPERVNFQMLTALDLSEKEWAEMAKNMPWHATRMNLNTFARHGVLKDEKMVDLIANKLKNAEDIKKVKVFPYQLLTAYLNTGGDVPSKIKNALQDALEVATTNVPALKGKVAVAVDCSGSMGCPVTGNRKGATTVVNCNQVGSLMAASLLRVCDDITVMRFDTNAQKLTLNARDSVMTNTQKIGLNGGGTDCASPIRLYNQQKLKADVFIILSDNMSWCNGAYYGNSTGTSAEWLEFKRNNPKAKLVCIDLAAGTTTQAKSTPDVLNVGGFSDNVFEVVSAFIESNGSSEFWTDKINAEVVL